MQIRWVRLALEDLEEIARFVSQDNPEAAQELVRRIWEAAQMLADHPRSGRAGRVLGTRELVIGATQYILPYRVIEGEVQILRVLHGARKWPKGF
jgi:addiction module RelE/StbE family toxin